MTRKLTNRSMLKYGEQCFFCSVLISSQRKSIEESTPTLVQSVQCLLRYLGVDTTNLSLIKTYTPQSRLVAEEKGELREEITAKLCEECTSLVGTFSRSQRKLEKARMEVLSSIERIHNKLIIPPPTHNNHTVSEAGGNDLSGNSNSLKALKAEAIRNCSYKIRHAAPRVKIEKMGRLEEERSAHMVNSKPAVKSDEEEIFPELTNDFPSEPIVEICYVKVEQPNLELTSVDDVPNPGADSSDDAGGDPEITFSNLPTINKIVHLGLSLGLKCQVCNKTFSRKDDFSAHKNRKSCRARPNPKHNWHCELCGTGFSKSYNLQKHRRELHLQPRSHECKICRSKFNRKANLEQHLSTHPKGNKRIQSI